MNSRAGNTTDTVTRGFTLLRGSREEIKPLLQHLAYSVYFLSCYPGYNTLHELLQLPP